MIDSNYLLYIIGLLAIVAVVLAVKKAVGCLVKTLFLIVVLAAAYYFFFMQ